MLLGKLGKKLRSRAVMRARKRAVTTQDWKH